MNKTITPPKLNTRIPKQKNRYDLKEVDETLKQDQQISLNTTIPSKLRKPEIIVPKSLKDTIAPTKKEISVNYSRRPSYPTAANEILQEQWDKEREKSRRLSANLISAHGLISQPEEIGEGNTFSPISISRSASHESRMEKIHDRLQCLVDIDNIEHEQSEPIEYKKECGNTDIMSPKGKLLKKS
jgi:hypothetical protein